MREEIKRRDRRKDGERESQRAARKEDVSETNSRLEKNRCSSKKE